MVSKQLVIVLLLVLPLLAQAGAKRAKCSVTVSQNLADAGSKYNTYSATVSNVGSTAASSIVLSPSATLRSVTGLDASSSSKYTMTGKDTLNAGESYSFTYSVKKSNTVSWSTTCTASSSTTQAPTTTTKPPKATTTTAKPTKATTTQAPKATTTQAPSKATTATPTKSSTAAPSSGGGSNSGGRKCSSGWWRPSPGTTWQWQLTGTVDTSFDVQMYDIDLFDATADLISTLQSQGKAVICYFSTQYENWRPDSASFPASVLGNNLDDWVGEKYVDIRSPILKTIMGARLDLALSKGCDGVEPDNVDGYENSSGFPLTAADQIAYNTWFATAGHARGLSVGLKNDPDQAETLQPAFDWALDEQCNQYSECSTFNSFITAGKAVFNCEYSGSPATVCPKMVTAKFSTLFKSLSLEAAIKAQCCTYASGGCATKAPYTCVTSKRSLSDTDVIDEIDEIESDPVIDATTEDNLNSASTASISIVLLASVVAALSILL